MCCLACLNVYLVHRYDYEFRDMSREEMKRKFAPTMHFVDEYLKDVVSQPDPFGDSEKNELTLEVRLWLVPITVLTHVIFHKCGQKTMQKCYDIVSWSIQQHHF